VHIGVLHIWSTRRRMEIGYIIIEGLDHVPVAVRVVTVR
jgi:hypothetical protein